MMGYPTLFMFCVVAIMNTNAEQPLQGCNIEIHNAGSEISTPNHPNEFPKNVDCTQLVSFPPNKRILLTFLTFDLETSLFGDCDTWLDIHDGGKASAPLLVNRLCGKAEPGKLLSSSNKLVLRFHSDSCNFGCTTGYRIKVEEGSSLECACEHTNKNSEQNGIVCKENGTLTKSTFCPPDESCIGVHWTMASNLASAAMELCDKTYLVKTYQNVNNSYCADRIYNSYLSLDEAKMACYHDTTCIGVLDQGCEDKKYALCKKIFITHPTISSCIYNKREMKSLPADFIWSTKGKTCSKMDENQLKEFFVPAIRNYSGNQNSYYAFNENAYGARARCDQYCSQNIICWGCSASCQGTRCKWIAIHHADQLYLGKDWLLEIYPKNPSALILS